MTDIADGQNPDSSTADAERDRDPARAALRDLVALSARTADEESAIAQMHAAALDAAEKELARTRSNLEMRAKALRDEVQQKHQARIEQIEQQAQAELAAQKESETARRRRISEEHDNAAREINGRVQQAVWLAESLLEGVQNGLKDEAKRGKDEHAKQLESLDGLEAQAAALVESYRQRSPTDIPVPIEKVEGDPGQVLTAAVHEAEQRLAELRSLVLPKLFGGIKPFVIGIVLCAACAVVASWIGAGRPMSAGEMQALSPDIKSIGAGIGVGALLLGVVGSILYFVARAQVRAAMLPLRKATADARVVAVAATEAASEQRAARRARAVNKRNIEVQSVKNQYAPQLVRAAKTREAAIEALDAESSHKLERIESHHAKGLAEINSWQQQNLNHIEQRVQLELNGAENRHEASIGQAEKELASETAALRERWENGLAGIQSPLQETRSGSARPMRWDDAGWKDWSPPKQFHPKIRFGELRVDIRQVAARVPQRLALPPTFAVPAMLSLPRNASLTIHFDRAGRQQAIATLQTTMLRLLTNLPAGRVRFTLIDPVGLGQNFAGFMHLADHDEALVGGRIWTEAEHIDQRLTDLTEHMETVIQKYLRNEFQTIDDYNAQAGELAEPYRFLVIADLPTNFSTESMRRLSAISSTGSRCGVYTLISRDLRQPLPGGVHFDEVESHSINLVQQPDGRFVWNDEVFKQFPLALDEPPTEDFLTRLMDVVGRAAMEAKRVEVPFESIAPPVEKFWSLETKTDLSVPIGRAGATRLQSLRLGRGVAQHALIAGKTGSGKSTLLHALVTNTAMWYSPREVEFYLVDFKKGVEFKTYASNELPHARAIAVESDREFGLSVLQRIDAELTRRGNLFRKAGAQEIGAYRATTGETMPRTLLIIDEFQEFFSEDDKLGQDAAVLLDRLVRQGRAFGIHVLLGSQTIGGTSGLSRSTIGQMAIRIALQTSEADSQLILGDSNSAARLLTRPGEAIYNDAGGLVENNSPFQVAWLPDEQRDVFLQRVRDKAQANGVHVEPAIVFEGNAPADITKNRKLLSLLTGGPTSVGQSSPPRAYLGDPVAIKEPTAVTFRRQAGANVLIVGQQDELAMALMASSIISLAAQSSSAQFYVLDGSPADSALASVMPKLCDAIGERVHLIEYRATEETISQLAGELQRRGSEGGANPSPIYLFVYALQRYRALRRSEDASFSFGSSDGGKKPQPDKQFADILRDGPPAGMHVIVWCDTAAALERTLDRGAMREFDNRILFQMSANDSSNLIDSPAGNKLGSYRALLYSEEQGVTEKFRPYALPGAKWLELVTKSLKK